jgi:hypothetical protein
MPEDKFSSVSGINITAPSAGGEVVPATSSMITEASAASADLQMTRYKMTQELMAQLSTMQGRLPQEVDKKLQAFLQQLNIEQLSPQDTFNDKQPILSEKTINLSTTDQPALRQLSNLLSLQPFSALPPAIKPENSTKMTPDSIFSTLVQLIQRQPTTWTLDSPLGKSAINWLVQSQLALNPEYWRNLPSQSKNQLTQLGALPPENEATLPQKKFIQQITSRLFNFLAQQKDLSSSSQPQMTLTKNNTAYSATSTVMNILKTPNTPQINTNNIFIEAALNKFLQELPPETTQLPLQIKDLLQQMREIIQKVQTPKLNDNTHNQTDTSAIKIPIISEPTATNSTITPLVTSPNSAITPLVTPSNREITPLVTPPNSAITPPVTPSNGEITPPVTSPNNAITPPVTSPNNAITPLVTSLNSAITPPVTPPNNAITPPVTSPNSSIAPPVTSPNNAITPPVTSPNSSITPPVTSPNSAITPLVTPPNRAITPPVTPPNSSLLLAKTSTENIVIPLPIYKNITYSTHSQTNNDSHIDSINYIKNTLNTFLSSALQVGKLNSEKTKFSIDESSLFEITKNKTPNTPDVNHPLIEQKINNLWNRWIIQLSVQKIIQSPELLAQAKNSLEQKIWLPKDQAELSQQRNVIDAMQKSTMNFMQTVAQTQSSSPLISNSTVNTTPENEIQAIEAISRNVKGTNNIALQQLLTSLRQMIPLSGLPTAEKLPESLILPADSLIDQFNTSLLTGDSVRSWMQFLLQPLDSNNNYSKVMQQWLLQLLQHKLKNDMPSQQVRNDSSDQINTKEQLNALIKLANQSLESIRSPEQPMNHNNNGLVPALLHIPLPPQPNNDESGAFTLQRNTKEDNERGWNISLYLEPAKLGPIRFQARIALPEIALSIVAEKPTTVDLIKKTYPMLEQRFQTLGLTPQTLQIRQGKTKLDPPAPATTKGFSIKV